MEMLLFEMPFTCVVLLFPYAHVKLDKISQIIDHYSSTAVNALLTNNIVYLKDYRKKK